MEPTAIHKIQAAKLMDDTPPVFANPSKRRIFRKCCPKGTTGDHEIIMTMWKESNELPAKMSDTLFIMSPDVFTYGPNDPDTCDWHLNFADARLFGFYGGSLLAQDELQVLEHPILGAVREGYKDKVKLRTTDARAHIATPILLSGIERRCHFHTEPTAQADRGLYGGNFAHASDDVVMAATEVIDPPTISNIIAVEAKSYGKGVYKRETIVSILKACYTGFAAAKYHTNMLGLGKVVIHTGYWGCGAYGGNREMMIMLQMLGARLADIDTVVFHTVDIAGTEDYESALIRFTGVNDHDINKAIDDIVAMGLRWGVSNGT